MLGGVGALCLSSCGCYSAAKHHEIHRNPVATRTSTRPPHPLHPAPCPYRTRDAGVPILSAFGRQNSSGCSASTCNLTMEGAKVAPVIKEIHTHGRSSNC